MSKHRPLAQNRSATPGQLEMYAREAERLAIPKEACICDYLRFQRENLPCPVHNASGRLRGEG